MPLTPPRSALAIARKASGLTQEQLAQALNVEVSTVGRWETGRHRPQPYLWPKLARLLNVSQAAVSDLLRTAAAPSALPVSTTAAPTVPDAGLDGLVRTAAQESLSFASRATETSASDDLIDHLRWELQRLAADYVYRPVRQLFPDLVATRNDLFALLDKRQRPRQSQQLYFLGGAACLLLAHASQNFGNQRRHRPTAHGRDVCRHGRPRRITGLGAGYRRPY